MLPLTIAGPGKEHTVIRVGGNAEVKKHLEDLGFVGGSVVEVISSTGGDVIVSIKGTRIAISKELAVKIMVNA